jgi:hypothetical protein
MAEAIRENSELALEIKGEEVEDEIEKEEAIDRKGDGAKPPGDVGKLVVAEEIAEGRVRWDVLQLYVFAIGGVLTWTFILLTDASAAALNAFEVWYLGFWARQYELKPPSKISVS